MKLEHMHPDPEADENRLRELQRLLEQPSYEQVRPCPHCQQPCTCSQSKTCTCMCGPDCSYAPVEMSSDGQRYPIEEKIVAMVFAFNCLRICPPYWSCEGHSFADGELYRVPQVWFYSRSLLYPKVIGDYVHRLQTRKAIQNPWHICLAYAESSLETGFSIEPKTGVIKKPDLETMQAEVRIISNGLVSGLKSLAKECIANYQLKLTKP